MQRRKGTQSSKRTYRNRTKRNRSSTHRSKRIICNRTKRNRIKRNQTKRNRTNGGDYTNATTTERELVPIGPKGVVVAMPGYVFSAEEYVRHMENMDRHGSD
jgi:hypothetical protein